MLETLLKILPWNIHREAAEITIEDDGDINLYWPDVSVCIDPSGKVNWSSIDPPAHGNDIRGLEALLCGQAK